LGTILQKVLNEEGISKAALGRADGLNPTTVHFLCKDPKYHNKTKELTKRNVISAISRLGRSNKEYRMEELFPNK
jgi:hypothetical protein